MDLKLLKILRCTACYGQLTCHADLTDHKNRVIDGILTCCDCHKTYPIIRSIPRFVEMENYGSSFGYQWNLYKYTQVDKFSGINHSEERFLTETQWTQESLKDNWVLDAGCGNGRFLEVCSRFDCDVVGIDISSAIDAAGELFKERDNVHLIQASIYELPFAKEFFDKCYSIGVIQHTPDPAKSVETLPQFLKQKGQLALTIYERKLVTPLYAKYWIRPLTKRLNQKVLLKSIKILSPVLFPVTDLLFRIPILNKIFKFIIPYANYVDMKKLSTKQRYEWAILDTFDMLSPAFDLPMTEREVRNSLEKVAMKNITRLDNLGLNVIAMR